MAGAKYGASRADKVSKAWKEVLALKKKFGFPEFDNPRDINDNWHISYSMPHTSVSALRRESHIVFDGMGRMPWSQQPKEKNVKSP